MPSRNPINDQQILKHYASWAIAAAFLTLVSDSPALGLFTGAAIGLLWGNPIRQSTGKAAKYLLQAAVILLGFGLSFGSVLRVGASSIGITFTSITLTLAAGWWIGRMLSVNRHLSILVSSGTAICGGSAIAAMAPAIGASSADTAIAMAVVFVLNGVALFTFPAIGHAFNLTEGQFGLWSALAIHDTSSVVGAAGVYGSHALAIATTVKLTRALWILPLAFVGATIAKSSVKAKIPWFLFGFLLAAAASSYISPVAIVSGALAGLGKKLMVTTLFLIGANLTREDLRTIGARPLLKGLILWIIVATASLLAVRLGWCAVPLPT